MGTEPEFGWRKLATLPNQHVSDEECICESIDRLGNRSKPTGTRYQSHDLEVTLGGFIVPGFYEVKRLHLREGKYVDRRFKVGRRGERMYGRRDAEIKSFATALEDFLDGVWDSPHPAIHWGKKEVEDMHSFIDLALQRKHGKKFHDRLLRLADACNSIPTMLKQSLSVSRGSVRPQDIEAGFAGLSGIFIIAGHIYTLVKPKEYKSFIGFDSASAEGPKLTYQGVVPLEKFGKVKG